MTKIHIIPLFGVLIAIVFALTGCMTLGENPRPRPGSYASATVKVCFSDGNSLGRHNFGSFAGERDGIAYTNCGGHIDIAHLRIAADNVYSLYQKMSRRLESGDTDFTAKLNTDTSTFAVNIEYPPDFACSPR